MRNVEVTQSTSESQVVTVKLMLGTIVGWLEVPGEDFGTAGCAYLSRTLCNLHLNTTVSLSKYMYFG